VLFAPERDEQFGYPDPEGGEAMEPRVATGADGNQPVAVVESRLTMMHMEAAGRPAGPTLVTVAL
jgi:hypothetical protein